MLALATLLFLHAGADAGDIAKGAALYRSCQAELRLMVPEGMTQAAEGDLVGGSYCIGYLNGFIANLPHGSITVCTEGRPMASLVRAYVTYMNRNPQYLEQDKRVGVRLALEAAFTCPAESGSTQHPS